MKGPAALLGDLEATLAKKQAVTDQLGAIAMRLAEDREALLSMCKRLTFNLTSVRLIGGANDKRSALCAEALALVNRLEGK